MKRSFSLYIFTIVSMLFVLTSCEKYIDTTPPKIEFYLINENDGSKEIDVDTLSTELEFRAFFTDESGMLSYTITFESKDNDVPGLRVPAFLNAYDTFPIAGAQTEILRTIKVVTGPDSENSLVAATGEYSIHMDAKDISLNDAERATIAMEFRNYTPFYKFHDFMTDSVQATKGSDFPINFTLDDLDNNMNEFTMDMYFIVYDPEAVEEGGKIETLIHQFPVDIPSPGEAPKKYEESFVFPDTGLYELRFEAKDDRRNATAAVINITVPN